MLWAVFYSVTNISGKLQRKDFPKKSSQTLYVVVFSRVYWFMRIYVV